MSKLKIGWDWDGLVLESTLNSKTKQDWGLGNMTPKIDHQLTGLKLERIFEEDDLSSVHMLTGELMLIVW